MTLNITVATDQRIYQCADYRFTDVATGRHYDDARNQKLFVAAGHMWLATVCFNGVGRTATVEVSSWLSNACKAGSQEESLDDFLARLQTADSWLSSAPPQHRRHSFIVAAFIGRMPIVALVSNYECFDRPPSAVAANRLSIHQRCPTRPQTFVSGQPNEIGRPRRRALATLAAESRDTDKVFAALARANQDVARRNAAVSASCFTTFVRRTGEGAGRPHEIAIPADLDRVSPMKGLDIFLRSPPKEVDLRGRTLRQLAFAHAWPTDEYHAIQVEDKPDSADTHSNYGAYLMDKRGDLDGAEFAYRRALSIDPSHANALGNLAIVMERRGNSGEADALYRQALANARGQENATYNYASFLRREGKDAAQVRQVIEGGIRQNPNSARLELLLGEVELVDCRPDLALTAFRRARELGADQASVEMGYAVALQASRAPRDDCIAAYRTAIALNPSNGGLRLNMAQLLFAAGLDEQARAMLQQAWQMGLDPPSQLEAHFYALAHTSANARAEISAIRRLLDTGVRMNWDMTLTLERVSHRDPARAKSLDQLREILQGRVPLSQLGQLIRQLAGTTRRDCR